MDLVEGHSLAEVIGQLARDQARNPNSLSMGDGKATRADEDTKPVAVLSTERLQGGGTYFRTVARLGIEAAEALAHAHQQWIVHRDIKPSNLMIDASGHLWVADFGLAMSQTDSGLTMTGDLLGTLRYMSPEQASGQRVLLDNRTDIYSLGATLYELATLQPAFNEVSRQELLRQVIEVDPVPPMQIDGRIPRDLETIILKAMRKVPDERYATCEEMAADLHRFLNHEPIRAKPPTVLEVAAKWSRRHWAILWVAAAMMMVLTGVSTMSALLLSRSYRELRVQQQETLNERNAALVNQYRADIASGFSDWQDGNLARLGRKLMSHLPAADQPDRRGWEWYYLLSQCYPEERSLYHEGKIANIAWSPDGEFIASTGYFGSCKIWDADTGRLHRVFDETMELKRGAAWSPDGHQLAWGTSATASKIMVWDRRGDTIRSLSGHEFSLGWVEWHPNGDKLLSCSYDRSLKIWDPQTGDCENTFRTRFQLTYAAWSNDGKCCGLVWIRSTSPQNHG